MAPGAALGSLLADLDREIEAWQAGGGQGQAVWAIEVGVEDLGTRLIAIRAGAPGEPLQVLGPDGEVAEVSRDDLRRHLAENHLSGPVRSLALLRASAGPTARSGTPQYSALPPDLRGFAIQAMRSRPLEAGNPGQFVAGRIREDVGLWQQSQSGRLAVTDEFYVLDIEPPPDQVGTTGRLVIRVSGDWSHPAYGGGENPEIMVEVREPDGRISAMAIGELADWLDQRLAGERGTLHLGRETPCPGLGPYLAALERARGPRRRSPRHAQSGALLFQAASAGPGGPRRSCAPDLKVSEA